MSCVAKDKWKAELGALLSQGLLWGGALKMSSDPINALWSTVSRVQGGEGSLDQVNDRKGRQSAMQTWFDGMTQTC